VNYDPKLLLEIYFESLAYTINPIENYINGLLGSLMSSLAHEISIWSPLSPLWSSRS